jgi:acyl-ACP thioesterase
MKIQQTAKIEYDEVDATFQLKLPMLFQRFQRAALCHSERVGLGPKAMMQKGGAWILHKMRAEIYRMPTYAEALTVETWHKGSRGFRAERAFRLSCADETVCLAESQWLYLDLKKKQIVKIPHTVSEPYSTEKEDVLGKSAIDFSVDRGFEPEERLALCTRAGDYDSNGHVNNTVYLEYLDTILQQSRFGPGHIRRIAIQFIKEIKKDVHSVHVGVSRAEESLKFQCFNGSTVYAAGFIH